MSIAIPLQPAETRIVLDGISWDAFEKLADEREGSVPRMTYDQGVLELMSPLRVHENMGCLLGRLVETWTEVFEIEILSVASTTFKRKDLKRAFEADESYYIANAGLMHGRDEVDLKVDPPPDLVIEIEITTSAIRKLKLFAAMGVPEVWRHDGERLQMHHLHDGRYEIIETSAVLQGLTAARIDAIIQQRFTIGETAMIREFRRSLS